MEASGLNRSCIKTQRYFQKSWKIENLTTYRCAKTPKVGFLSIQKLILKIQTNYNWTTADWMSMGLSLNRQERENTPGWHHASKCAGPNSIYKMFCLKD